MDADAKCNDSARIFRDVLDTRHKQERATGELVYKMRDENHNIVFVVVDVVVSVNPTFSIRAARRIPEPISRGI